MPEFPKPILAEKPEKKELAIFQSEDKLPFEKELVNSSGGKALKELFEFVVSLDIRGIFNKEVLPGKYTDEHPLHHLTGTLYGNPIWSEGQSFRDEVINSEAREIKFELLEKEEEKIMRMIINLMTTKTCYQYIFDAHKNGNVDYDVRTKPFPPKK